MILVCFAMVPLYMMCVCCVNCMPHSYRQNRHIHSNCHVYSYFQDAWNCNHRAITTHNNDIATKNNKAYGKDYWKTFKAECKWLLPCDPFTYAQHRRTMDHSHVMHGTYIYHYLTGCTTSQAVNLHAVQWCRDGHSCSPSKGCSGHNHCRYSAPEDLRGLHGR